jgi:tRNA(Ile)-lysidine synthase
MTGRGSFEKKILAHILRHELLAPGDHVLAAVSGGPDSVALLHVLLALRADLNWDRVTVIHFDHELRGESSTRDRLFVESLAERLGLAFLCGNGGVRSLQRRRRISLEMAARSRRRSFYRESLGATGARTLALGHTADDQAEEVLLRLLRGTGASGLAGMLPKTDWGAVRPLLCVTKREILDYLAEKSLPFREDPSNLEPFCQRNVLRNEVFPLLREHFHPRTVEVLSRHAQLSLDEEDFWRDRVQAAWPTVCPRETGERVVLNLPVLLSLHRALQRRVLRRAIELARRSLMGIYFIHVENLRKWAEKPGAGGILELPAHLRALKEGERLVLALERHLREPETFAESISAPGRYEFARPGLRLELSERRLEPDPSGGPPEVPTASRRLDWMDADKVLWPLTLRPWKPGDRFRPLGAGGSKKLQDFFTDAKIPRTERRGIPVLCDREKICSIPGYRLDERVKVTSETRRVLVVEFFREEAPEPESP